MSKKIINEKFIRNKGLKYTQQRLFLSKILFSRKDKHFSAEDIKKLVNKKETKISLATIYNNLNHFVKIGLLKKRNVGNNRLYYDNNITDHYHLYDEENETLLDIPKSSVRFSKLPKLPKNKKIRNINLIINLEKINK